MCHHSYLPTGTGSLGAGCGVGALVGVETGCRTGSGNSNGSTKISRRSSPMRPMVRFLSANQIYFAFSFLLQEEEK